MKFLKLASVTIALVLSTSANAATIVHYENDFNFYSPTGELLVEYEMRFNADTFTGSTYNFALGRGYENYKLEFDLTTTGLVDSLHAFSINFDTPTVQNLDFHGGSGIHTFNTSSNASSLTGNHGLFQDDILMHVVVDVDLRNNIWSMSENGAHRFTTTFYADNNDIESIRMGLSPWHGSADYDPNTFAILDNVVVSSTVVPVAPAIWLFGSGLIGLVGFARRKKT